MRIRALLPVIIMGSSFLVSAPALAAATGGAHASDDATTTTTTAPSPSAVGGRAYGQPDPMATPTTGGPKAKIVAGLAYAPANAPDEVKQAIWAANEIVGSPYVYGGGHRSFRSKGYDCSGTVSYALHGGGLLDTPLDSGSFMTWGDPGEGAWITVYANAGHAYVVIAGLRLDTSAAGDPSGLSGPRWRPNLRETGRFTATHPDGF